MSDSRSEACGLGREATDTTCTSKKETSIHLCLFFFHNSSACQTEKTLVEQYLKRYSGRKNFMYCNEVLKEPYTYLCCNCQKLLVKHHHLEEELATITTQIDAIFEALFRGVHSVSDNDNIDFGSITGTNQP